MKNTSIFFSLYHRPFTGIGLVMIWTALFHFMYAFWYTHLQTFVIPKLPDSENYSCHTGTIVIEKSSLFAFVKSYIGEFFCAGKEEMLYRVVPLVSFQVFLLFIKGTDRTNMIALSAVVIVSSAYFGFIHGNYINIFLQGVVGLFLSFIFLAGGGYMRKEYTFSKVVYLSCFGVFCSTLAHGLINISI